MGKRKGRAESGYGVGRVCLVVVEWRAKATNTGLRGGPQPGPGPRPFPPPPAQALKEDLTWGF